MYAFAPPWPQRGFSLLEVLVSMVVLSIGALGVMGLVLHAQQANEQALQRGRAALLTSDMLERIRANATVRALDIYNVGDGIGGGQQSDGAPDCRLNSCSTTEMAAFDLADWERQIVQSQADGTTADGLPEARGCIDVAGSGNSRQVTVTLAWRGTGAGSADGGCAADDISAARQTVSATTDYYLNNT